MSGKDAPSAVRFVLTNTTLSRSSFSHVIVWTKDEPCTNNYRVTNHQPTGIPLVLSACRHCGMMFPGTQAALPQQASGNLSRRTHLKLLCRQPPYRLAPAPSCQCPRNERYCNPQQTDAAFDIGFAKRKALFVRGISS